MLGVEQAIEAIRTPTEHWRTKKVRLQGSALSNQDLATLTAAVVQHHTVRSIEIVHCRIRPSGLRDFAQQLPDCNLSILKLIRVGINADACASITGAIQECHIQKLDLSNNGIAARGARSIANMLRDCGLQSLYIGQNNIGEEGGMALARVLLERSHCLQTLDLRMCHIGSRAAILIAQALEGSTLQALQLDHNDLDLTNVHAFCLALPRCRLESLFLGGNNLKNDSLFALSAVINDNPNMALRRLFLHSNQFTDMGVTRLFQAIDLFHPMQAVDIRENPRVVHSGEYIFRCIKTHRSLKQLLLAGTSIPLEIQMKLSKRVKVLTIYKSTLLVYVCFSKLRGTSRLSVLPVDLLICIGRSIPN